MGLRLYRHYQDDKYAYLLLQGVLYTDQALNKLVKSGLDSLSIEKYIKKNNKSYKGNTKKKKLRKKTLKTYPRYRFMATKVLRHVARLDELGLQHKKHKKSKANAPILQRQLSNHFLSLMIFVLLPINIDVQKLVA